MFCKASVCLWSFSLSICLLFKLLIDRQICRWGQKCVWNTGWEGYIYRWKRKSIHSWVIVKNSSHPPTVGRLTVNCQPTVGRLLADSWLTISLLQSANKQPTVLVKIVGWQLAICRPTVGKLLVTFRWSVGMLSTTTFRNYCVTYDQNRIWKLPCALYGKQ